MRSSWPSRFLLPLSQVLAEGAWLAVCYAALQAVAGGVAWMGPIELAIIAWTGMAWGRRQRWRTPTAEALGLPLLALAAGALGWLIDPHVRQALIQGDPLGALSLHVPGWVAGIAFWRGEVHRSADDDDAIQDRLLRWAIPGLAVPWVIGHAASDGALEREFTAAAFIATAFFVASAFSAMGLARLEAVRAATGSDWRANRSWLVLVLGVAMCVTLIAIPAASLLGIPARSLLTALLGPLQALFFLVLLAATPIVVAAAAVADLIGPFLPEGFGLSGIDLPDLAVDASQVVSSAPVVLFYVIVALIVLVELTVLGLIIWVRWQERRRMQMATLDPFEERTIVVPPPDASTQREPRPRRPRANRGDDPVGAYLQALSAMERDGRWPRQPAETPAVHAARARGAGFGSISLARLAAAYQLMRYGEHRLTTREAGRAGRRLRRLRRDLGR